MRIRLLAVAVVGLAGVLCAAAVPAATASSAPARALVRDWKQVMPIWITLGVHGLPIPFDHSSIQTASPVAIAVTPNARTAYVASEDELGTVSTVTPIDLRTDTAGAPISVPEFPQGVAISPNGRTVWVSSTSFLTNAGAVTPISTATNRAGAEIAIPADAGPIAIAPNGKTLYAVSAITPPVGIASIYVTPVNTSTGAVGTPLFVGKGLPEQLAITPDGKKLYLTNYFGKVYSITLATGAVTAISVGGDPFGVAIDPTGVTAMVSNVATNSIVPISIATDTHGLPITGLSAPEGLAYEPAGGRVWVVIPNTVAGQIGGSLVPVTGSIIGRGIFAGPAPDSVAITPDQPAIARFSARHDRHGRRVVFDARASRPRTSPIATYSWRFGDGTSEVTTGPVTIHRYARPGRYRVTLVVTDTAGTSTRRIFTGQSVSRNGSRIARARRRIRIR